VPLLVAEPNTEVRLLIRAASEAAMAERVDELNRFWGWNNDDAKTRQIRVLRGDATQPCFGLTDAQYVSLSEECTHIIHSAGTVRMNLTLEEARRSAVGSAEQIVALAQQIAKTGKLAKVDFVSTVGVAGKRNGTLPESWLEEMPSFHNTYEEAKAEAEEVIRLAVEDSNLPITVHRPSMVIGDSRDGRVIHFQIFYFLCEFLSGRKTAGFFPDFADIQLDVIPSDVVAAAIVNASQCPATAGRIFHLCSGPAAAPRLEEVKAIVRKAFSARGLAVPLAINLPINWFAGFCRIALRLLPARQQRALATLPIYLDYLADRQSFGNSAFSEWFSAEGHEVPRWQNYLPKVLDYYLERRY
jgi:thioester reductase-like protein